MSPAISRRRRGHMQQDSIYALASGPGRAGLAVVRLSGSRAGAALDALAGAPRPAARTATLRRLCDPRSGEELDRALVLWFPGPKSFTGEDMAEFHLHGGRAVLDGVLRALGGLAGLRPAEPGEFARRAFAQGKFDLTAAEGLADLVAAETSAQRRQALRQMGGALGRLYDGWRERLVTIMGHWEALIDFPDEDLPERVLDEAKQSVSDLIRDMRAHLGDDRRGERLRDGFHMALVGEPNVGKSSLLNALARREAAIVSEEAGTTRDIIEVHLEIGGFPVILADTAGLRNALGAVEKEGVRRALARAEHADLKLLVTDSRHGAALPESLKSLTDGDTIRVGNKADLVDSAAEPPDIVFVSAKTGQGLDRLLGLVGERIAKDWGETSHPSLTRERHRQAVGEACAALERVGGAELPELAAEDLRLAARALGRITGRVEVEEVLDVVFRDFCIGK